MAVFRIDRRRNHRAGRALLGEDYAGTVCTDRFSAHDAWPQRGLCWAYLVRDFQATAERFSSEWYAQHTDLLARLHKLAVVAGESSTLLLDPNTNVYYLVDLLVERLLPLMQATTHLRNEGGALLVQQSQGYSAELITNAVRLGGQTDFVDSRLIQMQERLDALGEPTCFPTPLPTGRSALDTKGIYDVCLALHLDGRVVGNDVNADDVASILTAPMVVVWLLT